MRKTVTRPLDIDELKEIINLIEVGGYPFYRNGKEEIAKPNSRVAFALKLEVNLGLRISDILRLRVSNFQRDKLQIIEKKTGKLQHRKIDPSISYMVKDFAIEHKLGTDDLLIGRKIGTINYNIKNAREYLNLNNVATHSFRKTYATLQYEKSNNNLELVKELLNHSSVATTQRYIRVHQKEIDEASGSFYLDV